MSAHAPLTVAPLTPADRDAWLAFFDGPAFADNAEWGTCYCRCMVFGAQGGDAWDQACARKGENRAAMVDAIGKGDIDGLLARRDGEVVGWLHFGPASRFVSPMGPLHPGSAADEAAIVCFVVAAPHRRTGVARALLSGAVDALRARGFRAVHARAAAHADEPAMEQFTGPLALFEAAGFTVAAHDPRPNPNPKRVLVSRAL